MSSPLIVSVTVCFLFSCCACGHSHNAIECETEAVIMTRVDSIPSEVQVLLSCYKESILTYKEGLFFFKNGNTLVFDDLKEKSFLQELDDADIQDMFQIPYKRLLQPSYLQDPGRIRCEEFFKNLYGETETAVRSNLVKVNWFGGQMLWFNQRNGAADSLRAVFNELSKMPDSYHRFLTGSSSFYWRKVRGAERLSPHSFGIAIDINTKYADYWHWSFPKAGELDQIEYRNRIPVEIVEIFEKHSFISGTRWYHFDTMHFEFRPEMIGLDSQ